MTALAYSLKGAAASCGLSATHLTDAINAGALRAKKSGRDKDGNPIGKYVILAAALQTYLDGLVDA